MLLFQNSKLFFIFYFKINISRNSRIVCSYQKDRRPNAVNLHQNETKCHRKKVWGLIDSSRTPISSKLLVNLLLQQYYTHSRRTTGIVSLPGLLATRPAEYLKISFGKSRKSKENTVQFVRCKSTMLRLITRKV